MGGHLTELMQLNPLFNQYDYLIITENKDVNKSLKTRFEGKIAFLIYGTKRQILVYPFKFLYNTFKSLSIFIKFKPDCIVTTGAHTAVPMCFIAKIFGKKVIYIETMANISSKSLTGRIIYRIADLFIVQWESMLKLYPEAIYGGIIF